MNYCLKAYATGLIAAWALYALLSYLLSDKLPWELLHADKHRKHLPVHHDLTKATWNGNFKMFNYITKGSSAAALDKLLLNQHYESLFPRSKNPGHRLFSYEFSKSHCEHYFSHFQTLGLQLNLIGLHTLQDNRLGKGTKKGQLFLWILAHLTYHSNLM